MADHLLQRRSGEPPIGLDRHDLRRARWLTARAMKRSQQGAANSDLSIGETRGPAAAGDQPRLEVQLSRRERLAHDQVDELGWGTDARAHRLKGRTGLESGD